MIGPDQTRRRWWAALVAACLFAGAAALCFWPDRVGPGRQAPTRAAPHAASALAAAAPRPGPEALVSPGPPLPGGFAAMTPEEARAKNAQTPFSTAPNPAARAFAPPAAAEDRALAQRCLTEAVYYEAGFEPLQGRRAVAQVVLNRVRHALFPKTICGVVYQGADLPTGCQFTFTCDGSIRRAPVLSAWKAAAEVAAQALNGYVEISVGGATHYHAEYVYPFWIPTLEKVRKIGAHIFYRWPGTMGLPSAFMNPYAGGEPSVDLRFAEWLSPRAGGAEYALTDAPAPPVPQLDPDPPPIKVEAPVELKPSQTVSLAAHQAPGGLTVNAPPTVDIRPPIRRQIPIGLQSACSAGVIDCGP